MRTRTKLVLLAMACCSFGGSGIANAADRPQAHGASGAKPVTIRLDGNGLGVASFGATVSSVTKAITTVLGKPTGHPSAGCTSVYSQTAWHDLIIQFVSGRFRGYRYEAGGWGGALPSSPGKTQTPKLATIGGIALNSTWTQAKRAYPSMRHTATEVWTASNGIAFEFWIPSGKAASNSPIYEIKNNVCPAAI